MMNEDMTENILLTRVENLEAQLRRLKQMGLILALAICSALLMGQATVRPVIDAKKIVIRHSNGNAAIVLETEKDGASLKLYGTKGDVRADLSINSGGSFFTLTPPANTVSLELSAAGILGSAQQVIGEVGSMAILKKESSSSGQALVDISGTLTQVTHGSRVLLYGPNQGQADFRVDYDGPRLQFRGTPDTVRASFSPDHLAFINDKTSATLSGLEPSLKLTDADGYTTAIGQEDLVTERTGEKRKTSAASVVLFGKDGKVIWRTP